MKIKNNKGSALLQVLVIGALIATIVVVLLRFSVTRTANMSQTRNLVGSNLAVQSCMDSLNEEETRRMSLGILPYFDEGHSEYACALSGYQVVITRDTTAYASNVNRLNITVSVL